MSMTTLSAKPRVAPSADTAFCLPALNDTKVMPSLSGALANPERRKYPPVTVKVAAGRAEREAAFRLVYQRYLGSGLCAANPHAMRVTPYHMLDTTTMFTAHYQGEVIFTVSLIGDGELGVPMESIFPDEVERLRDRGVRFGEISCLADRRKDMVRILPVLLQATSLMYQFGARHGVDRYLIAVHPKHGRFYERYFGFRQLAGERPYSSVRNNPAVAYEVEPGWLPKERHEAIFGKPFPAEELRPQPLSAAERAYFGPMAAPMGELELVSGGCDLA